MFSTLIILIIVFAGEQICVTLFSGTWQQICRGINFWDN